MANRYPLTVQLHHIQAWLLSGLSKQDYCAREKLTLSTFYYWLNKNKFDAEKSNIGAAGRTELLRDDPNTVTLHLPNGCSVSCYPGQLATIMQALALA
ncbi:IS66 family insertion sequence element accessory protein TnpA [Sodalis sp. RH14]|uniref:IS66 family insertion sequence element accessory protein TnpA n=1 Tax=Sodalis sp. RH14 TaxID=3394329 RepID=UPI0039B5F790